MEASKSMTLNLRQLKVPDVDFPYENLQVYVGDVYKSPTITNHYEPQLDTEVTYFFISENEVITFRPLMNTVKIEPFDQVFLPPSISLLKVNSIEASECYLWLRKRLNKHLINVIDKHFSTFEDD